MPTDSNFDSTSKSPFATGCTTRKPFNPSDHVSCAEPAGTDNTKSVPFNDTDPFPTGFSTDHNPVFNATA